MSRPRDTAESEMVAPTPGGRLLNCRRIVGHLLLLLALFISLSSCAALSLACDSSDVEGADGDATSTTEDGKPASGDVQGTVDEEIKVGNAIVTVRALEATFQPAMPEQRLSEQAPAGPGAGESFYQAYVRVHNTGVTPIRVDPTDFTCAVGESVVGIEPTRSGPLSRSLLKGTSLDLVLTFKAPAGFEPVLIYRPPWHQGAITISPETAETATTTT